MASTVFRLVLKSSMLPLIILQALNRSGENGARVGSWRDWLVWSLLGGDCGLLICFLYILGDEVVDAREGFGGDYLLGLACLGGQTFPNG
jgi:hypothetical protein